MEAIKLQVSANFCIRAATEADILDIQQIYAHHVLNGSGTFEEIPPDEAEMKLRFKAICKVGLPYLVAVKNGAIIGFCYANYYRQRSAYRYTLEDSIYIAKNSQGLGVGYLLLKELINQSQKIGCRQVLAFIGDSQNSGSIKLHESLNFIQTGTLKKVGFKFNRWIDVVIMQLDLITTK